MSDVVRRPGFWSDVAVVAGYELAQAGRTRLLQVALLLYAAATGAAHWGFIQGLREAERSVAGAMGVPATEKPGALINKVLESEDLRQFLGSIVGSPQLLDRLIHEPVLGLWSGAVAMVLLPLLLVLGTSVSVATEVETHSIRFLALRTERLPIVFGKLVGQVLMAAVAALVGVAVTEVIGLTLMVQVPAAGLAISALHRAACALLYALPFAGLGLCVSQWVGRTNPARALAVVALLAVVIGSAWLQYVEAPTVAGQIAAVARGFLPGQGWMDVWQADPLPFAMGAARLVVLTIIWVALGYLRFDRRDL